YRIVPTQVKQQRAHAEAMRQFLAHGLHLTEARTGVLIFASAAERYAEIIADTGIHAKVGNAVWEQAIATMIAAIKAGRPGDGFIAAIEQCGAVLAQHFPPGAINRVELTKKLVGMCGFEVRLLPVMRTRSRDHSSHVYPLSPFCPIRLTLRQKDSQHGQTDICAEPQVDSGFGPTGAARRVRAVVRRARQGPRRRSDIERLLRLVRR